MHKSYRGSEFRDKFMPLSLDKGHFTFGRSYIDIIVIWRIIKIK